MGVQWWRKIPLKRWVTNETGGRGGDMMTGSSLEFHSRSVMLEELQDCFVGGGVRF